MSGGHFDYSQYKIFQIVEDIEYIIKGNGVADEDGYSYEYPPEIIEKFKEAAHWCNRAAEMVQRIDWLVSGDDGEDSFLSRWEEEVRKP